MKKFVCLLAVLTSACVPLAGCSSDGAGSGGGGSLGLSYGTEYVDRSYNDAYEMEYSALFRADGTGEYHYYQLTIAIHSIQHYTVFFRYLYYPEENAVFCFYDSVEYEDDHDPSYTVQSTWNRSFLCTDELLYDSGGNLYLNEEYRSDFPNFNMPPADSSEE